MGVFLHAIVCRKQDIVDVQALVKQLAAQEQDKEFKNFPEECTVTECQGGISIQLNDYCLEPDGVAKTLSQHSTLVLHQGEGKMACLFFAGGSMSYYELIGDFNAYYNIDIEKLRWIPIGGAMLSEYCVFEERNAIDKALCLLFADLENADNWLEKSSFWSAEITWPGGVNNYNRRRREFGLLED